MSNPLVPLYSYLNLLCRGALCHALLITLWRFLQAGRMYSYRPALFYKCTLHISLFDLVL